jgi:hypothetical protein
MKYEDAVRIWASEKWRLPIDKIKRVTIDHDRGWGGGCPTCGYGEDECSFEVVVFFSNKVKQWPQGYSRFELPPTSLPIIVQEILEAIDE